MKKLITAAAGFIADARFYSLREMQKRLAAQNEMVREAILALETNSTRFMEYAY